MRSHKPAIGYFVSLTPGDFCYRIRTLHEGETVPENAYWSGGNWLDAQKYMREANQKRRGEPVYVVLHNEYYGMWIVNKYMVKTGETLDLQPNEVWRDLNYLGAKDKLKEFRREYQAQKKIRKLEQEREALRERIALLVKEPWNPKVER